MGPQPLTNPQILIFPVRVEGGRISSSKRVCKVAVDVHAKEGGTFFSCLSLCPSPLFLDLPLIDPLLGKATAPRSPPPPTNPPPPIPSFFYLLLPNSAATPEPYSLLLPSSLMCCPILLHHPFYLSALYCYLPDLLHTLSASTQQCHTRAPPLCFPSAELLSSSSPHLLLLLPSRLVALKLFPSLLLPDITSLPHSFFSASSLDNAPCFFLSPIAPSGFLLNLNVNYC